AEDEEVSAREEHATALTVVDVVDRGEHAAHARADVSVVARVGGEVDPDRPPEQLGERDRALRAPAALPRQDAPFGGDATGGIVGSHPGARADRPRRDRARDEVAKVAEE